MPHQFVYNIDAPVSIPNGDWSGFEHVSPAGTSEVPRESLDNHDEVIYVDISFI